VVPPFGDDPLSTPGPDGRTVAEPLAATGVAPAPSEFPRPEDFGSPESIAAGADPAAGGISTGAEYMAPVRPPEPTASNAPADGMGVADPLRAGGIVPAPQDDAGGRWGQPSGGSPSGDVAGGHPAANGALAQPAPSTRRGRSDLAVAALASLPKASTLVFDRQLHYTVAAGRAPGHHGLAPEELEGQPADVVLGPDWWEIYGPLYRAALDGESRSLEIWSNDGTRCYLIEVGPLHDGAEEVTGGVAVFRDITRRKRVDEARYDAEERFELLFEQSPIGMALLSLEGRWVRANPSLVEITGHTSDALAASSVQELTYPDDRSNDADELRALIAGDLSEYRVEKRMFHARGHVITVVLWVSVVRDRAGKPQNLIAQVQDITERKLMEQRVRALAEQDPLTGLCNRRLFEHELGVQVDRERRGIPGVRGGDGSALLILDLDNFRRVNESAGHRVGDELLRAIGAALQERLRGTDLIARLDGDEFGVLLRGTPIHAAEAVAKGLGGVVADCGLENGGRQVSCTASIGVAAIGPEGDDQETVRVTAEQAMYQDKLTKRRAYANEEPVGIESRATDLD
jgi:diguanylate cyclase (GGDEF)-like protein/PAS domain S-box-containing protein